MKNDLKNVIKELGNSPLEELELAELFEEKESFEVVQEVWALKCKDLNVDDFTHKELEEFFKELENKVFSHEDKDGNLKSTELTKNIKPLSFFDGAKYKTLQKKQSSNLTKMMELRGYLHDESRAEKTIAEIKKIDKERIAVEKDLEKLIFKDIETKDLSKWEKQLIGKTVDFLVVNPEKTVQGKNS